MSFDSSTKSANSGSKSKTSLNSNSASHGSEKKKTLCRAWGSTSLSSFRSASFSYFDSYMEVKNRKLHDQFDAEASSASHSDSASGRPIFHGVSILVDGYTVPSSQGGLNMNKETVECQPNSVYNIQHWISDTIGRMDLFFSSVP